MTQNSQTKQAVVIRALSGALFVATSVVGYLLLTRGEQSNEVAPVAASDMRDATLGGLTSLSPPSASESMKELFGWKPGAEEVKTGQDKLTKAAFSEAFTLGAGRYFAQFFQRQQILGDGAVNEAHAATVSLSVITYKQIDGAWRIVDKRIDLTESGAWGQLHEAPVQRIQLSPASFGLLIQEGSIGQGYSDGGKSVLVYTIDQWHDAGVVQTSASNGGSCETGPKNGESDEYMRACFEYDGKISVDPNASGEFPDLLVTKKGTQEGERPNQVMPARSVIFKFINGKYESPSELKI